MAVCAMCVCLREQTHRQYKSRHSAGAVAALQDIMWYACTQHIHATTPRQGQGNMPPASLDAVCKQRLKRCIVEASVHPQQSTCAKQ